MKKKEAYRGKPQERENINFNFNPGRKYDIVLAWLLSEEL